MVKNLIIKPSPFSERFAAMVELATIHEMSHKYKGSLGDVFAWFIHISQHFRQSLATLCGLGVAW